MLKKKQYIVLFLTMPYIPIDFVIEIISVCR